MSMHIIHISIVFAFYIIGAFSTTDILRLLNGQTASVSDPYCYCPVCGNKIPLYDQIPIFSYFINHQKCRFCGSKIPPSELFLELLIFSSLSFISVISDFSYSGFFLCFLFYQFIKMICLLRRKPRKNDFVKNLFLSSLHNVILFTLLFFLFFLEHLIA